MRSEQGPVEKHGNNEEPVPAALVYADPLARSRRPVSRDGTSCSLVEIHSNFKDEEYPRRNIPEDCNVQGHPHESLQYGRLKALFHPTAKYCIQADLVSVLCKIKLYNASSRIPHVNSNTHTNVPHLPMQFTTFNLLKVIITTCQMHFSVQTRTQ